VDGDRVTKNFSINSEFKQTTVGGQSKEAAQIQILLIVIMKNPSFHVGSLYRPQKKMNH